MFETHEQLTVVPTLECNLHCGHCWTESCPHNGPSLEDLPALHRLLEVLAARQLKKVVIDGGEPLLVPQVVRGLLDLCGRYGLDVTLRTNGTLLPDSPVLPALEKYEKASLEISTGDFHGTEASLSRIIGSLGEGLRRRTTVIRYDNGASLHWSKKDRVAYPDVRLATGRSFHFGRGHDLPVRNESQDVTEMPLCQRIGQELSLYPDGGLWACGGFLVCELYQRRNLQSPLYLGNILSDGAMACLDRLVTRPYLRILRQVGHHGIMTLLNLTDLPRKAQTCPPDRSMPGEHGGPASSSNGRDKYEHPCHLCRALLQMPGIVEKLDRVQQDCATARRIQKVWDLRQELTPAG